MARRVPLLLLPPSEGKEMGGTGPPADPAGLVFPELAPLRLEIADALAASMARPTAARRKLLGVKGDALERATAANLDVAEGPTLPAIDRYTGVLYDALAYRSLPARSRRRIDAQVLIFSGLWGLVAPRDPIPDYRLKMGAGLPAPIGRLSSRWKEPLSTALNDHAAGRTVWDLLPNEHAAAWEPDGRISLHYRVRFVEMVGGKSRTIAHWNKLLKGSLVAFVADRQARDADELADFDHPEGYRYRPDLTETNGAVHTLVLVRT